MNMDTHMSGSTVKNHIFIKKGIRIQCNTENFVPVVVPGLSTSSSSGLPTSTPKTPSSQEITFQQSSQVKVWIDKHGETRSHSENIRRVVT